MKLLPAEDEKRMAQALCEILRLEKYDVDWCADGNTGMNAVESGIYDLIVLDVMLLGTNTASLRCLTNGQSVRLSEKEYHILEYLIANQGHVLTREQFAVKIWGFESDAEYNNVEVYMSFTRRKLAFVGAKTEIKAIRGIGYDGKRRTTESVGFYPVG